jgi:hypothetical protein
MQHLPDLNGEGRRIVQKKAPYRVPCDQHRFLLQFFQCPGSNTRGANFYTLRLAFYFDMHFLKIGQPAAFRHIVGMTDFMTDHGTFSANITSSRHVFPLTLFRQTAVFKSIIIQNIRLKSKPEIEIGNYKFSAFH